MPNGWRANDDALPYANYGTGQWMEQPQRRQSEPNPQFASPSHAQMQTANTTPPRPTEELNPHVKQDAAAVEQQGYRPSMFSTEGRPGKLFQAMKTTFSSSEKAPPSDHVMTIGGYSRGEGTSRDLDIKWSRNDIVKYLGYQSPVQVSNNGYNGAPISSIAEVDLSKLHLSANIDQTFLEFANNKR